MGIYGRSLFKSASDTSLYVRREKQSRITAKSTDRLDALKDSLARGKCSSDTKFKERLLDKIFEDSSSADESEKDFKDFIQIFSYSKVNLKKGFFLSKSSVTDRFDSVREKILNKSVKLDVSIQKKMNYRSSSASRNTSACFYPCDFYTRRKKREPKSYMHVNSFNHSFDNPSKYRFNRQRSLSPNLPKIPYLEKPPQYTTHPLISSQRKSRIIFKDKSCKDRQKVNRNASKKSIPEHALMKNLLSGLSIFENEDVDVVGSHTKNFHKHKSMGNIKSSTTENYILKSNYKSDVDFRDSIAGNPEEAVENFKGYCNSYKRTCPKRYEFQDYRCSGNGNCVNGERNINISKEREDQKFQRRNTLVERRKNFFENRKKQMELENVKLKPTTLVISCVGRQIQNDDEKSDDITEIYRNFHSVHSTSTISKRSSSLPPLSRFRRSNGRNGSELFNPDYNFCCENSTGARNSIIETIRSKVFQTNNNAKKECTDKWNSEPTYIPKFPKETRTAMSIILSNKNSSVSCKFCREKFHRKQLVHIETQTSPQISRHKILQSSGDVPKLPCPKNLLCDKGYHPGKCEESIRRKLNVVCDEHCVCRENRRMLEFGYGVIWPGQAVRLRKNLDSEQSPSEDFLGLIRPDLDISEEKLDYQHQRIHGE